MHNPATDVGTGNVLHRRSNGMIKSFTTKRRETTAEIFDLHPDLFDKIELRRVRWGEEHGASHLKTTLGYSGVLMSREVIHDDDVAWSKVGEKLLGDESIENGDACSRIDRHPSTKAVEVTCPQLPVHLL